MPKVTSWTLKSAFRRSVQWLLKLYLLLLVPLAFFQRSLIYHPTREKSLIAKDFGFSPNVTDLTVKAHDGIELHGWLSVALTGDAQNVVDAEDIAAAIPVVLYFSGNAGNRSLRYTQIMALNSLGADVAIFDYRGFGENEGSPTEANFALDARTIWDHFTNERQISPQRIVIYGESLGGGTAARLASDLCHEGIEPGGLILQSTFSSLVDVGWAHFPIVPVSLLLLDQFPSSERVRSVTCPVLQIHGQQDSIVPYAIGQKLYHAVPEKSSRGIAKRLVTLPNTDHNDVYSLSQDHQLFLQSLREFFAALSD